MRFTIKWTDSAEYRVSIPNYNGGEVITADEYDALKLVAIEACQEMGCYCEGPAGAEPDMENEDREKCVMCRLSDVIRADSQAQRGTVTND